MAEYPKMDEEELLNKVEQVMQGGGAGSPEKTSYGVGNQGKTYHNTAFRTVDKIRPAILAEKEKTHGNWKTTAIASREIKEAIARWDVNGIPAQQREVLDQCAVKFARILAGDPKSKQHWEDIIGYAQLGLEGCD